MASDSNDVVVYDDVKKIWKKIARFSSSSDISYELEVHKYLLSIFHVGDFYYYFFNCSTAEIEFTSDAVVKILGIEEPADFTINYLLSIIHPDDLAYFLDFEQTVTAFFNQLPAEKVKKYKVSYDYRVRTTNGDYKRILQQVVTIQSDEKGAVLRVIGVHTDITHWKKENGSTLSFIGLEGEPSYLNYAEGKSTQPALPKLFTKKEEEILRLLAAGQTSVDIASSLYISKQTVDRHRKNMLAKCGLKNTMELVMYAIQTGYL